MTEAYHFIGIGGVGMSALAHILLNQNRKVSGSDAKSSTVLDNLIEKGAKVSLIQQKSNISKDQTIVYSTAIKDDNLELVEAKRLGLKLLHRSDLLTDMMSSKKELIVAGAHGKTTTTALLSHVLQIASFDPSFAIGGFSPSLEGNGRGGKGEYFVAEGDESDGSFLKTKPFGAILNNIDSDHIGYHWNSYNDLLKAYQTFIEMVEQPECFIYNGDDKKLQEWAPKGVSFGVSKDVDVRAENISSDNFGMKFDIVDGSNCVQDINFAMIGRHNMLNALGVYALASRLGVSELSLREAFSTFKGVERRMELKGSVDNIYVIDDYAHHPKEIVETVEALSQAFPVRRLIKVFQPHRYSRIASLLEEFIEVLEAISENLIITDIFAAGESPEGLITTEKFLDAIETKTEFQYVPRNSISNYMSKIVEPGDIVLMMGAGDITKESLKLVQEIEKSISLTP